MGLKLLIVGTGAVATAACVALARSYPDSGWDVTVAGRDIRALRTLVFVGNTVAATSAAPVRFNAELIDRLDTLITSLDPHLVLCAASLSSSWEQETHPSRWTTAATGSGFGLTVPLHFAIVGQIAQAMADYRPDRVLVNACYPDLLNRILRLRGGPQLCGIGNVSTVAAAIQNALNLPTQDRFSVLAHHRHLYPGLEPADDARLWIDDQPQTCTHLLADQRATPRPARYPLIGTAFAELVLRAFDEEATARLHLPGVAGLVGGCRARVGRGQIEPDPPPSITTDEINDWALQHAAREGAIIEQRHLRFTGHSAETLEHELACYREGIPIDELDDAVPRFLELRERMRRA